MTLIKCVLLICTLLPAIASGQSSIVQFKISKPVCILSFLQALNNDANISGTYKAYISSHTPKGDSASLTELGHAFGQLQLYTTYNFDADLTVRQKPRSTYDLIKMAAVQAGDANRFMQRISGIIPNATWLQLKDIFTKAEPFYDKIIWNEHKTAIYQQADSLKRYTPFANKAFEAINTFYGSTWTADLPFTVAIYPIPGNRGNTTATPHSHCLVMGVLTGDRRYTDGMGVVLHEISHVLYDEQPLQLQQQLDRAFQNSKSLYSRYAYSYLNEALATACGNGWAYKYINGTADTSAWYNDEYIDKYAHAIYPLTERYINTGKTIDSSFIADAITVFEKALPGALYSYNNLLNNMCFYTDAEDASQYHRISSARERCFRSSSVYGSYPLTDAESLDMLRHKNETQLCLVYTKHEENFKALQKIFPRLKNISPRKEQIISFYDDAGRAVIIVAVHDESRIEPAFQKMRKLKQFTPQQLTVDLE